MTIHQLLEKSKAPQASASSAHFPRVLVICFHSLNSSSATGIVFSHLFGSWPKGSLAQIYSEVLPPDSHICNHTYRISAENVGLDRAFRRLLRPKAVARLGSAPQPQFVEAVGGTSARRRRMRSVLTAWTDMVPFHLDGEFHTWLKDFTPEVIFTNLGSIRQMRMATQIARLTGAPIVTYFNDDWPSTHFADDILKKVPRLLLQRELRRVFPLTVAGAAASTAMATEYRQRFGLPFEPFMYCFSSPAAPPPPPAGDEVRFCYVGGLHLDRWRALAAIGTAAAQLRSSSRGVRILVYAPEADLRQYGALLSAAGIEVMGSLRAEEVQDVLVQHHVLVHVESFHEQLRRYTRLSFSTKLPQYLAAGRPILAWGPAELASCRYIAETGTGLVVGEQREDLVQCALTTLAADSELRRTMGERAWSTAKEKHDPTSMCERFRALLAGAAVKTDG
jgi:hypothetical protein